MCDTKTVSSDMDDLSLYVQQAKDVAAMRTSLLTFNRNDPNSTRKAIQNITVSDFELSEERYMCRDDLVDEVWPPLKYWKQGNTYYQLVDGYMISNMGRAKRASHQCTYVRYGNEIISRHPERMLKRHVDFNGYNTVSLTSIDPKRESMLVRLGRIVCK